MSLGVGGDRRAAADASGGVGMDTDSGPPAAAAPVDSRDWAALNDARNLALQTQEQLRALECPLCLQTMVRPSSLATCGHSFCRECIGRVRDLRCPICRQGFDPGQIQPNFVAASLVEASAAAGSTGLSQGMGGVSLSGAGLPLAPPGLAGHVGAPAAPVAPRPPSPRDAGFDLEGMRLLSEDLILDFAEYMGSVHDAGASAPGPLRVDRMFGSLDAFSAALAQLGFAPAHSCPWVRLGLACLEGPLPSADQIERRASFVLRLLPLCRSTP